MPDVLRRGSSGADVAQLQTLLNTRGANIAVDSQFGAGTEAAVRAFQASVGLTVDGIVGPATWTKLSSPIAGAPGSPWSIKSRLMIAGAALSVFGAVLYFNRGR